MIFFTADEHHGHRNIIKFCKRPFQNVDDMTDGLVIRHNSLVGENDTVYHLGDMFWRYGADPISIMGRLNGKHIYLRGNHEEAFKLYPALLDHFESQLVGGTTITHDGQRIFLNHYAHRVWPGSGKGAWHLYGHSHGELPPLGLSCDVGVDAWDYYPVSVVEIFFKMGQLQEMQVANSSSE